MEFLASTQEFEKVLFEARRAFSESVRPVKMGWERRVFEFSIYERGDFFECVKKLAEKCCEREFYFVILEPNPISYLGTFSITPSILCSTADSASDYLEFVNEPPAPGHIADAIVIITNVYAVFSPKMNWYLIGSRDADTATLDLSPSAASPPPEVVYRV